MATSSPVLRVRIPCQDEGEFYARLADRVAANGLRVPVDGVHPIGAHVSVALEFRDGRSLTGEGVVDAHVQLDAGPGVNVRFVRMRAPGAAAGGRGASAESPRASAAPPPLRPPAPDGAAPEEVIVVEASGSRDLMPPLPDLTVSGEILSHVARRTARLQRAALALVVLAILVAIAAYAALRLRSPTPAAAAAAHLAQADRLFSEGRFTGAGGALEHLVAAERLRPGDAATHERLSRAADLLQGLAARAMERGDLAVASVHLASARLAAPDRPAIAALQRALDERAAAAKLPPPARTRSAARERRGGAR